MSPHLQKLVDVKVQSILHEQDACTVVFDKGYVLTIFNPCSLKTAAHEIEKDTSLITGKRLSFVEEKPGSTIFNFEGNELSIDLSDGAWTGPEAAVLYKDRAPLVVW